MNNSLPPNAALYYDFTRDPFCKKSLDLSMVSKSFPNLLINPQLEDKDGNGIIDSWPAYIPPGVTGACEKDGDYAKISISSSSAEASYIQCSQYVNIVEGQGFSLRAFAKVSTPDVTAMVRIAWYSDAGYGGIIGDAVTAATEDTCIAVENAVAPATATKLQIIMRLTVSSGNTGTGWFKAPELIRNSTFTQPNKSAMLYGPKWRPEGLVFDGVDDYCTVENNADADITVATPERPLTIATVARINVDNIMQFIIVRSTESYTTYQYGTYFDSGYKVLRTVIRSGDNFKYTLGIQMKPGEPIFYLYSYDGSRIKEYKNGALIRTESAPNVPLVSRQYTIIGARMDVPPSRRAAYFNGTISEIYLGHAQPDELISWFERTGRFERYGIAR